MDSENRQLIIRTEGSCLSHGRVLNRLYELLRDELLCFTFEKTEYTDLLHGHIWC